MAASFKKLTKVAPFVQNGLWFRTFDQWSEEGYRIRKGSKALLRDSLGQPCFSEDQVVGDDDGEVEEVDY